MIWGYPDFWKHPCGEMDAAYFNMTKLGHPLKKSKVWVAHAKWPITETCLVQQVQITRNSNHLTISFYHLFYFWNSPPKRGVFKMHRFNMLGFWDHPQVIPPKHDQSGPDLLGKGVVVGGWTDDELETLAAWWL